MTEEEWLACTDPLRMYGHLRSAGLIQGNRSRKYRLYNAACCRRLWPLLTDGRSREAVEVVERYVDGLATEDDEGRACGEAADAATSLAGAARAKYGSTGGADAGTAAALHAADTVVALAEGSPDVDGYAAAAVVRASGTAPYRPGRFNEVVEEERRRLSDLYRDIFGNPFRPPPPIGPAVLAWNGGTVRHLAEDGYEHRLLHSGRLDPKRLAVLADALDEAGGDAELAGHLRGPGPHVRGCFVLDLILGKE